jgi:hypothetical protein
MKIAGAFEIKTNNYTLPQYAKKSEKYKCPDCNMDLIFKKGQIIKQHFAHKANSNCTYYDHPSESQLHKDAKNRLGQWIKDKKKLKIKTKCNSCNEKCKTKKLKYNDNDNVIIEYNSKCKKYIADIAITESDNVRYILEVTNTHRTIDKAAECRPEPWFDIMADEIIKKTNSTKKCLKLNCIRTDANRFCDTCSENIKLIEKVKKRFININKEIELRWDCVICNESPGSDCIRLTEKYNIRLDYKIENINIDIAIFEKDILKYCIIFRKHLIEKLPEKIKWFYYDPKELLKQIDDIDKDPDRYYTFYCKESNYGKYCWYSFCTDEKWLAKLPIIKNEYEYENDKCKICKSSNNFFCFQRDYSKNLPGAIRFCNDCIYGNCRDKLEKYMKVNRKKRTPIHNNYIIYLNVPYREKDRAKKLGAKWCGEKKKWYAPVFKEELFSRWIK